MSVSRKEVLKAFADVRGSCPAGSVLLKGDKYYMVSQADVAGYEHQLTDASFEKAVWEEIERQIQ